MATSERGVLSNELLSRLLVYLFTRLLLYSSTDLLLYSISKSR